MGAIVTRPVMPLSVGAAVQDMRAAASMATPMHVKVRAVGPLPVVA
jgi:hypothetical protein